MNCLDTNALIDYLDGAEAIGEFVQTHADQPLFAPTIALYEVFVGAARLRGEGGVTKAREDLDWVEPLPLTADGAAEAALIDAELHANGTPIGGMDTLIAGTIRDGGGTVVTADDHFQRVSNLDVELYR